VKLALDEQSGLDEGDRMLLDRLSQTLAHGCLHLFTLSAREGTVEPRRARVLDSLEAVPGLVPARVELADASPRLPPRHAPEDSERDSMWHGCGTKPIPLAWPEVGNRL